MLGPSRSDSEDSSTERRRLREESPPAVARDFEGSPPPWKDKSAKDSDCIFVGFKYIIYILYVDNL